MTIVYHEDYLQLTQDFRHPERPERLSSIMEYLELNRVEAEIIKPEPTTIDEAAKVHNLEYLEFLRDFGQGHMDMDSYIWPHTYEMALLAAGGGLLAARTAFETGEPSFALVRPPGHHATRHHGGGFCYINNVALAARALLADTERVAIVDVDVHHGNGTHDIFYDSKEVLFISTHQWGIYPGSGTANQTGSGEGEGYTVNIPFDSRTGDSTFLEAYDSIIVPILRKYQPGIILVSLGIDAHYMDPLASLTLSSSGYVEIMTRLHALSKELSEGRLAVSLEGGYNLEAIADVVGTTVSHFHGGTLATKYDDVYDGDCLGRDRIDEVLDAQGQYWDL